MKERLKPLTNFLFMRTRRTRIANYLILGLLAIYLSFIVYPNVLFGHTLKYGHFNVHSTTAFGNNIQTILDDAEKRLSASEIYNQNFTQDIYLCNGYTLYSFLAPMSRKAFACNYPFINTIFIAHSDIEKNEAYKYDEQDNYVRQLSQLIAHETTHTLIEKRLGFWKYRVLTTWKNEGYCEYIGYNSVDALKDARQFLATHKEDNSGRAVYHKYYYAVTFLKEAEKMTFDDIIKTDVTFDQVLNQIEQTVK
ncbi:MAG TPA: hypothetical protein VLY03_06770 [Bacteroidota bacterium]|nr:hypothetical protein [Bacteroidota bacterium]